MSIDKIRKLRAEIQSMTDKYERPFDYPCLLEKLKVLEHFMIENEVFVNGNGFGRGTVRFMINDIRLTLINSTWVDNSNFYDAPLFLGWSLMQIENSFTTDNADSIPEHVMITYTQYQEHKEFVKGD